MKGFIEVHEFESGYKILIAIGNISFVRYECDEKEKGCCKIGLLVGLKGVWVTVQESYDEVKALIADAQVGVGHRGYIEKTRIQGWVNEKLRSMYVSMHISESLFQFIVDLNDFLEKEVE